jgi:hypothetical protein
MNPVKLESFTEIQNYLERDCHIYPDQAYVLAQLIYWGKYGSVVVHKKGSNNEEIELSWEYNGEDDSYRVCYKV